MVDLSLIGLERETRGRKEENVKMREELDPMTLDDEILQLNSLHQKTICREPYKRGVKQHKRVRDATWLKKAFK